MFVIQSLQMCVWYEWNTLTLNQFFPSLERKYERKCQKQIIGLKENFDKNPRPNDTTVCIIAKQLKLSERQVRRWFENERHKVKRAKVEENPSIREKIGTGCKQSVNECLIYLLICAYTELILYIVGMHVYMCLYCPGLIH